MIIFKRLIVLCVACCGVSLLLPFSASAKPGTHGRAISTWDTTRSTAALMYHRGFILEGGDANNLGYNVNFTSTSGKLSSQFGLQYMNLSPQEPEDTMHGGTVSAVALYGVPMGKRYSNGLPKAALSFFFGAVPGVYTNGKYTFTTFPLVFGLGMVLNPIRHISITPWVEGAPSFNFDTVFRYDAFQNRINEGTIEDIDIEYGPNGEILDVSVANNVVEDLIDNAVEYKTTVAFRIRGGVSVAAHIGDRLDVQVNATVVQMGNDFDAKPTICIGGGLVWAWDDAPLGILPEKERARTLSCTAAGARFRDCSEYHTLIEQTRSAERALVEKECAKEIVVHEGDTNTDDASEPSPGAGGRPLSPTAVGVSASELQSVPNAVPPSAAKGSSSELPPAADDVVDDSADDAADDASPDAPTAVGVETPPAPPAPSSVPAEPAVPEDTPDNAPSEAPAPTESVPVP